MRVVYDPVTAIVSGIAGVASIGSGFIGAGQASDRGAYEYSRGLAERDYYEMQVQQERIALGRDLDASKRERDQTLSRTRALMAGQGGGMDTDYLGRLESEFAVYDSNLIADSNVRQNALRGKGSLAVRQGEFSRRQAEQQATSSLVKGFAGSLQPFATLYGEIKK
ncbi:MAG: hypothetical protein AB7U76_24495 [Pirellulales bacterium]